MGKNHAKVRGCVALDWDGVLSQGAGYHWPLTGLDLTLVHQAHARGYAVAIMTCNDVVLVAGELRRHGFRVQADIHMVRLHWDEPEVILITGRKIAATAYVDDRAIRYEFGEPASVVWDVVEPRRVVGHAIEDSIQDPFTGEITCRIII